MTWVAIAVGGSAVIGANAAGNAANKQANAAQAGLNLSKEQMDLLNAQQAPYRQTGERGLNKLSNFLGIRQAPIAPNWQDPRFSVQRDRTQGRETSQDTDAWNAAQAAYQQDLADYNSPDSNFGGGMHTFGAQDLNANMAPNWQFALQQGQGSIQNMANASGGLLSGNTMKGIQDYTLNKSGDLYQNAFQNYNTNQSNIFNRLSAIAGIGQTANAQSIQGSIPLTQSMVGSAGNIGAAQAAGTVGQANALSGGLNNAASWYGVNNLINPKSGGGGGFFEQTDPGAFGGGS